ncbi:hypothetical protein BGZ73_008506 [Actinomortierella ambigua]|nr:hypothetical protein BGZ73_008506 [Actinomortierella ambigua]
MIMTEPSSSAFPVEIPSDKSVGVLKKAIIGEKPNAFEHIDANDLTLWQVIIPVDEDAEDVKIATTDVVSKRLLKATVTLKKAFKDGAAEDTIHVLVERPKATSMPQTLELEAKMEELLVEIEDLRGGKDTITLNIVVRPNRSASFPWTTDTETATISKLEKAIYAVYPDKEDGEAVLAVIHPHGTSEGTEYPSDDAHLRDIIRLYRKTNTKTLTVALETPTKKYKDFTLKGVNSLYRISNMETPTMSDLPPFTGISTEPLGTKKHKQSLRRLLDELDSRIQAIPSDTFANGATCSAYVCSFLTQAVLIFNGELTLTPERPLRGKHGHGKVDYAIEAPAKDGSRHVLGVTEVKHEDYRKGLAQNLVQLESSLTVWKRKRSSDDNADEEREQDSSFPMKAYGIVTDASFWFFVECTIDPSQDSGDRPKFRVSRLDDIVNYNKSTWREEAASVLGQIVWLMRKMHSEIPRRELQLKKQKFTTSEQSSPPTGKMQRKRSRSSSETQLELEGANDNLASAQEELEDIRAKLDETELKQQSTQDALATSETARHAANLDRIVARPPRQQEVFIVLKFRSPQPLPVGGYRLFTLQQKAVERTLNQFIADNPELDAVVMDKLRFYRSPRGHNVFQRIKDDKHAPIKSSRRNFILNDGHTEDEMVDYITSVFNIHTRGQQTASKQQKIKPVKEIRKAKDFVLHRLGAIPVFFFLTVQSGTKSYAGPYRNVEKGLLIL